MRFQVSGIWIQILKYDASALYGIELEQVRVTSVTARRYDLTNWKAAHDKWLVVNSHLCFHRAPQSQRQLAGEEGKQKKKKRKEGATAVNLFLLCNLFIDLLVGPWTRTESVRVHCLRRVC